MPHHPSSGIPYVPDGDLGEFAPKGDKPTNLNMQGGADTKGLPEDGGEADAALAEFAPISAKSRISSMPSGSDKGEMTDIPKQTSGPSYTSQTKGPEPKGAKGV